MRRDLAGGVARIEVRQTAAGRWRVRVGPHSGIELGRKLIERDDPAAVQRLLLEGLCGLDEENRHDRLSRRQQRRLMVSALPELAAAVGFGAMAAFLILSRPTTRRLLLIVPALIAAMSCFYLWQAGKQLADALIGQLHWAEGLSRCGSATHRADIA